MFLLHYLIDQFLVSYILFYYYCITSTNFPNFPHHLFSGLSFISFSVQPLCQFQLLRKRNNNSPEKSHHLFQDFYFFRKGTPLSFIYFSGLPLYQLPFLRRPVLRGSSLHVNSSMTSLGTHTTPSKPLWVSSFATPSKPLCTSNRTLCNF